MVKRTFHPAAKEVWDKLDPALRDCICRVDDAMEQVRNGSGKAMVEVWADQTQDPGIMYVQPGAPTLYGQKGMETFRSVESVPHKGFNELTVEYQRIVVTKDLAYAVLIESSMTNPPGGDPFDLRGNVTYIYERFGDTWKLVHRHIHGMNKESLHTYDLLKCPECGVELLETPMKSHRMGVHGHSWKEIVGA